MLARDTCHLGSSDWTPAYVARCCSDMT
jgi:hypothetical protein